jgi:hypothetical protein
MVAASSRGSQQTGMTVRECRQVAGVHVSSFYRWRKLLAAAKTPSDVAPQRKAVLTPVRTRALCQ